MQGGNGLNITCIGYKTSFIGRSMYYYKIIKCNIANFEIDEYLIVYTPEDSSYCGFLDMIWTEKNEFANSNLSDFVIKTIKSKIDKVEKSDFLLEEDVEKTFFIQHKIVPKKLAKRKNKTYSANEFNRILDVLQEFDYIYTENEQKIITQEICDKTNLNDYTKGLFDELIGYKFEFESYGDHKNDGQMVDYTFTFISPKNKETTVYTEMCLMVGWNYCENVKIK